MITANTPIKVLGFSIYILLATSTQGFTQKDSARTQHAIKVNIPQLIVREVGLEYEFMHKQNIGFIIGAAYKFGNGDEISNIPFSFSTNYLIGNAVTFSAGPSVTVVRKKSFRLNLYPLLFGRKIWYDKLRYYDFYDDRTYIKSMRADVFGFKLLISQRWFIPLSNDLDFLIELYEGLGYREMKQHFTNYGTVSSYQNPTPYNYTAPHNTTENKIAVTVHLGLKLGLVF